MKNKQIILKNYTIDTIAILVGSLLFAISINTFMTPNNTIPAGITGIATMLNYLFNWPIGISNLIMNIPIFIWSIIILGYSVVSKTIIATVISSLAIDIIEPFSPHYTGDPMLASLAAGIILGLGLGIIFARGATTGGTDLLASILSFKFKHISIGKFILFVDVIIICASAFVYKSFESPMYAIILTFISTKIMDNILYGTDIGTGRMMFIVSSKTEEISKQIIKNINRGITKLKARGGYSGTEGEVLLCAVRKKEVYKIYDIAKNIDPDVFIMIGGSGEVMGRGFKDHRKK